MNGPAKLFKKKARIPLADVQTSPIKPATNIMSGFNQGVTTGTEQPPTPFKSKPASSALGIGGTISTGPTGPTDPIGPDKPPPDPFDPGGYDPDIQDPTADVLQQLKDQGYFESLGILEGLPPGMKEQMLKNLQDMMSGGMFDPYKSQSDESFARAAQQMRSQAGGMFAPQLGQGAAEKGMQGIEQNIMAGLTDKQLADQIAKGELMKEGTMMGMDLAKANEAKDQFLKNLQLQYQGMTSDENKLLAQLDLQGAMHMDSLKTQLQSLGMQIYSDEKLAADKNWLLQQGIDLDSAKMYGYTDQNGNHVMGELEMMALQFQAGMNSQAGLDFSSYVNANLEAGLDDPALQNLGQKLWESYGNEGDVPEWWLEQRILAAKDPKLTNPIIQQQMMMQQALDAGIITQEQYDDFMEMFTDMLTQGDDDDDLTDKQTYEEWWAENVPAEYQDLMNFDEWVAAGRPTNWQDYLDYKEGGGPGGGSDLVDPDRTNESLIMPVEDILEIFKSIDDGDPYVTQKYGLSEDSDLYNFSQEPYEGVEISTEKKEKYIKMGLEHRGRIVKAPNGKKYVIVNAEYGEYTGGEFVNAVYLIGIDPETGYRKKIPIAKYKFL